MGRVSHGAVAGLIDCRRTNPRALQPGLEHRKSLVNLTSGVHRFPFDASHRRWNYEDRAVFYPHNRVTYDGHHSADAPQAMRDDVGFYTGVLQHYADDPSGNTVRFIQR
jgi:hypothetical protein